jgi:hypothetical protein
VITGDLRLPISVQRVADSVQEEKKCKKSAEGMAKVAGAEASV